MDHIRTSRRALLGVAAASFAVPAAALAEGGPPNPDADLLLLGERWRAAQRAEAQAWEVYEAADDRFQAIAPQRPASLLVRGFDIGHGLAPSTHRVFTPDLLETIADIQADRLSRQPTTWHRAVIARCAELLGAIPAYYGAVDAALEASGFNSADTLHSVAARHAQELEQRLAALPAHTIQGVRLKAQLALSVAEPDDSYESEIFLAIFRQLAEPPA